MNIYYADCKRIEYFDSRVSQNE